jgi:predicted transcriptional regulator
MTTPNTLNAGLAVPGLRPGGALGLPPRHGEVLAVLWDSAQPPTAAQITARLPPGGGIHNALRQLHAAGLITATRTGDRARHYQPVMGRDDYLAALIAAALDQAADPAGVLRTALSAPLSTSPWER